MLSERQLEEILQVFRHRAQAVTEEYLIRMGQHLRDIGTLSASDVNRLIELKRMNYNMEQIKRQIAAAANVPLEEVEKVFRDVAESDLRFASKVFATDHTLSIKDNPALERILKAQAKITKQALNNLSQTTILSDSYKNAVDVAVQTAQAGITDYNSAIRKAMKAAARDGLRVQYPNSGYTRRLDSAVRMNVLDGIRAVNQDVMRQVGKEFGADGIELTAHNLCAEDHLPYQGLQMSNKEFDRLQNTILDRPFGMWNCRHSWHPILLGISQPAYSPEELAEFKRNSRERIEIDGVIKTRYEWTQEQRRVETAIRYQKDIAVAAKASGDMVARRECAYMIREMQKYYSKISEAAGLLEKPERMRVAGFTRVKPEDELKGALPAFAPAPQNTTTNIPQNAGFTVKLGELESKYGSAHALAISDRLSIAPENVRAVWNDCARDFHVLDTDVTGGATSAYYSSQYDGVWLNIDDVSTQKEYRQSYDTVFHEYGHHADFILNRRYGNGNQYTAYSETYGSGVFAQTLRKEAKAAIESFARKNNYGRFVDESEVRAKANRMVRRGLMQADEIEAYVKANRTVFEVDRSAAEKAFCDKINSELTLMERFDISDMFEPFMLPENEYPFGIGHGTQYWSSGIEANAAREAFAEMYSATTNNPQSLKQIKRFFPESYSIFEKMLEVVK